MLPGRRSDLIVSDPISTLSAYHLAGHGVHDHNWDPVLAGQRRTRRVTAIRAASRRGIRNRKRYETSRQSNDGASGSSNGRDTILERVIGIRENGLELEYDLPKNTKSEDRARNWQFPVRVFRPSGGSTRLLNRPELEVRIEGWIKAAGLTRADWIQV